ncbi:MAG TPA: bifunctional aldolase/short-chain dehydrogenase [Pseudonocardiaceae bacterium]|jgi:rhamnose utilization protein RhaD (predicted bifunctional aldolase and dehydrogenase)/NAD(P)-dependent dehydrogenase (short-subunit alcohol dehydrogenase family)|nr:bifunctional aldolase/short-chain dehydrogenase [Pseudonocardiaceae bacterium]
MENRWAEAPTDPLDACVYGSRLLGSEPALVLHGGGNTSVKVTGTDVTGAEVEILYVKGSGWDLAGIERPGFAPLRLDRLRELLSGVESLPDSAMMNELRCALLDASAPDPSVETLLHAVLPQPAVLHSHADAILSLTNLDKPRVAEVFGDRVVVIPYVMPGFGLAKVAAELYPKQANGNTVGVVLNNHGLFTFGADVREAYERHIELVTLAEEFLDSYRPARVEVVEPVVLPARIALLRKEISAAAGRPMIVSRQADPATLAFVGRADLAEVAGQGPVTPDHVIRTKRLPLVGTDIAGYVEGYQAYFDEHTRPGLTMLDPAPRVLLDSEFGMLTVGRRAADANAVADIYRHTFDIIERGALLGGYRALSAAELFEVEYWELEQAKLRRSGSGGEFTGEVALVTGAASGIGLACADALRAKGASVIGLDLTETPSSADQLGLRVDVTDRDAVGEAIARGVDRFGGIDMIVPSAGVFPGNMPIAELDPAAWQRAMAVNTEAIATLFSAVHPFLKVAPRGGRVVVIGSKNVPAPGPGAAAYSASKAAVTQLARVAALEWASDGIRVNVVHPDAVFDTGLWTEDVLRQRASHYGLTVEEYKRRNLLRTEVRSAGVGRLVAELCSDTFAYTTGAQIPVDGGNERVI